MYTSRIHLPFTDPTQECILVPFPVPPCNPVTSCRICKCDFTQSPWARLPTTNNGCLVCASPATRRTLDQPPSTPR
jgi:hypothetical protein